MRKTILVLALTAIVAGCQTGAVLLSSAQEVLKDYQLYFTDSNGNVATARAIVGANVKYLALGGDVDGKISFYGPNWDAGGQRMELWSREIKWTSGYRALGIFFTAEEGKSFVQIIEVPWEQARLHLSNLPPMPEGATGKPTEKALESPKVPVKKPDGGLLNP